MSFVAEFVFSVVILLVAVGCNNQPTGVQQIDPAQVSVNWFRADGKINWEAEKEQRHITTDTIVIHHTASMPGITWRQLSELEYNRLYVPRFKPNIPDPYIKEGTPVQSGHFRTEKGKKVEVFYAYHWLVRADGSTLRLLKDDEVGWHSGNWDMNNRSVAVCFDGDFREEGVKPTAAAMRACAKLIAGYRRKFEIKQVIGHFDVKATECPGPWFRNGGKDELLQLAK